MNLKFRDVLAGLALRDPGTTAPIPRRSRCRPKDHVPAQASRHAAVASGRSYAPARRARPVRRFESPRLRMAAVRRTARKWSGERADMARTLLQSSRCHNRSAPQSSRRPNRRTCPNRNRPSTGRAMFPSGPTLVVHDKHRSPTSSTRASVSHLTSTASDVTLPLGNAMEDAMSKFVQRPSSLSQPWSRTTALTAQSSSISNRNQRSRTIPFACACLRPAQAPTPPDAQLTSIITWLTINFDLAPTTSSPTSSCLRHRDDQRRHRALLGRRRSIRLTIRNRLDNRRDLRVNRKTRSTCPLDWTGSTPAELSVLVHEMVHHCKTSPNEIRMPAGTRATGLCRPTAMARSVRSHTGRRIPNRSVHAAGHDPLHARRPRGSDQRCRAERPSVAACQFTSVPIQRQNQQNAS